MHRILTSAAILAFIAPTTDAFTPLSMMPSSGFLERPEMRHSTKILAEETTTTSTSTTTFFESHCNRSQALQAFVWGDGGYGKLGLGDKRSRFKPVMLQVMKDAAAGGMPEVEWQQIAGGNFHTAGVTPTGELYSWGLGGSGRLGHGNEDDVDRPKLVTCLNGKKIVHVACGSVHTAVVTSEGELHTCGKGHSGELGHGNLDNLSTFSKVEGLEGHIVSQVACGIFHTIVLTSKGFVYTFGSKEYGQTGDGFMEGNQSTPKRVNGCLASKKVVFVDANDFHSACITEDGDTYTWGSGDYGKLGHGDNKSHSTPKLVEGLVGKKAEQVAFGWKHTIVRTEDGRVYSFGNGSYGQLGHGTSEAKSTPTLIQQPQLEGKCVVQVACGSEYSMALTSDGRLYSWGDGGYGKLGHGSELSTCVPSIVESLLGHKVVHIACHDENSVALVESKRLSYVKKMKAMIDNETCSDVVFVLKDGERVHANKGILIGQSDYFQAMFRSGMKESTENQVEVGDCSKGTFLLFLEYLYKGDVDIEVDNVIELYMLSDRYQENGLSNQCLGVMEKGLAHSNAIELLGETHGVPGLGDLEDICMDYVVSNYASIEKKGLDFLPNSLLVEMLKRL